MILMDHLNSPIPQLREDRELGDRLSAETGGGYGWERHQAAAVPADEGR